MEKSVPYGVQTKRKKSACIKLDNLIYAICV